MLSTWFLVSWLLLLDCLLLTPAEVLSKGKRSSLRNYLETLGSKSQLNDQYWKGRLADSKLGSEELDGSDAMDTIFENLWKKKLSDYNKNYDDNPQYWRGRFSRNNDPQFWKGRLARSKEEQGRFGREKQGRFGREEQGRFGREPKAQYWRGRFERGKEEQGRFGREEQGRFGREEQGRFGREFGREELETANDKQGRFGKKSAIMKADQKKKKSGITENEEIGKDKKSNIDKEDQGRFGKKSKIEYKSQGRFGKKSVIASEDDQGRFGRDRVGKNDKNDFIQRKTIAENYKGEDQGRFGRGKSSAYVDESHVIKNIDVQRSFDALKVEDSRFAGKRKRALKS